MGCHGQLKGRRAFTAFEVLLAAAILAIITAAVSSALMAGRAQSQLARDTLYASMLAHSMMDEVTRLPTADPHGYTTLGPDSGETRTTFNSIKDYNGYTDGPTGITDLAGTTFPDVYQTFTRTVTVANKTYTPAGWGYTVSGLLITVNVTKNGNSLVTLQRFACN